MVETKRVSSHNAVGHRVMEDWKRLEGEGRRLGWTAVRHRVHDQPLASESPIGPLEFGQAEKRVHVLSSHLRARSMMCRGRPLVEIALEDVLPGCICERRQRLLSLGSRAPFLFPKSDSLGKSRHLTPLTIPLDPPRNISAEDY